MNKRYDVLGYVMAKRGEAVMKKKEKCVYPNCFECPYEDCVQDGVFKGESALNAKLGQLIHKAKPKRDK